MIHFHSRGFPFHRGRRLRNNKNILDLNLAKGVEKTASDHKLTDYAAAIVYHSEKFSNR